MNAAKPREGEPLARAYTIGAFRPAALELFGQDGLAEIARLLPEDARRATMDVQGELTGWIPDAYALAWYDAIWEGPAAKREDLLIRFIERTIDRGFGRVRRLLLGALPPNLLLLKASKVWSHDHTQGELIAVITGPQSATLTLRDHISVASTLGRLSVTQGFRYGLSLSRASDVTARSALRGDDAFDVHLEWS